MIGYLDIPSGISGDMFLGCLVDVGWPIESLRRVVESLKLDACEWSVAARSVMKGSMRATLMEVHAAEGHVHRHLSDIREMIERSDLSDAIKSRSIAVFRRLASAEAKVHGSTPEEIHFHEVGAVDAIIDIVGSAAGLAELGIDKLYASSVPLGPGWAQTQHGQIPLPAPATLELLAAAGALTRPAPGAGEWVTPTGAALLAEFATFQQPAMNLQKIGVGAGRKDAPWPNIARLWLGQPVAGGSMVQLQTNIDDMNPQLYADVSEKLFDAGAADVWFTPIQMKKNRPGVMLSVLGTIANEQPLANIILRETTTLGVRVQPLAHRHEAQREIQSVQTAHGQLRVKIKYLDGAAVGVMPEYEDCKALAAKADVPVRMVWEAGVAAAQTFLSDAAPSDKMPRAFVPSPGTPGRVRVGVDRYEIVAWAMPTSSKASSCSKRSAVPTPCEIPANFSVFFDRQSTLKRSFMTVTEASLLYQTLFCTETLWVMTSGIPEEYEHTRRDGVVAPLLIFNTLTEKRQISYP